MLTNTSCTAGTKTHRDIISWKRQASKQHYLTVLTRDQRRRLPWKKMQIGNINITDYDLILFIKRVTSHKAKLIMTLVLIGRLGCSNLVQHNLLQSLINAYSMYLWKSALTPLVRFEALVTSAVVHRQTDTNIHRRPIILLCLVDIASLNLPQHLNIPQPPIYFYFLIFLSTWQCTLQTIIFYQLLPRTPNTNPDVDPDFLQSSCNHRPKLRQLCIATVFMLYISRKVTLGSPHP